MLDIKSFFHRPKNEQLTITTTSISLQLRYIENKQEKSILIQRTWNHDSKNFEEKFNVQNLNNPKENYSGEIAQIFINQLIPLELQIFLFFDGEKLQDLVMDENNYVFMNSVRVLLGLDLIERIERNISLYSRREIAKAGDDNSSEELKKLNNEIDSLKKKYKILEEKKLNLEDKRNTLKDHASIKETELSSLGGSFSINKKTIESSIEKNIKEAKIEENSLRDELSNLGVFSLCKNSLAKITIDISQYSESLIRQTNEFISKNESDILKNIVDKDFDLNNAQKAIDNLKIYLKKFKNEKTDYLSEFLVKNS